MGFQECLISKRPDYIKNAEERKTCLREWAKFREDKQSNRQKLLTLGTASTVKIKPENNPVFAGRMHYFPYLLYSELIPH